VKILVVHLGSLTDCISASCINRGLRRKFPDTSSIVWMTTDKDSANLFRYTDEATAWSQDKFLASPDYNEKYGLLINLHPSFLPSMSHIQYERGIGFGFDDKANEFRDVLFGSQRSTMSVFRIYFRLAGLSWRGESYGFRYYPKTKSRAKTAGIAVAHSNLRFFVNENLDLSSMRVSIASNKRNLFRRLDELNRFSEIVTDDMLTMHLAVFLRKYVHFLQTYSLNTQPEFFGAGRIYEVPLSVVR
jgi:hypothetical protein